MSTASFVLLAAPWVARLCKIISQPRSTIWCTQHIRARPSFSHGIPSKQEIDLRFGFVPYPLIVRHDAKIIKNFDQKKHPGHLSELSKQHIPFLPYNKVRLTVLRDHCGLKKRQPSFKGINCPSPYKDKELPEYLPGIVCRKC